MRESSPCCCASWAEIRIDTVWLVLGASDLRGGIDRLLAMAVHGFALGAQPHHASVFANRRADRLEVLVYDGAWPLIVVALPVSLTGIALGQRLCRGLDEARLRRLIWSLLAMLGRLGVARTGWLVMR